MTEAPPDTSRLVHRVGRGVSLAFTLTVLASGLAVSLALIWFNFHSAFTSPDHISTTADKPPTWDFTNLWFGGRLALEGRVDTLFDVEAYRIELRAMFSPIMADSEWSYPPLALVFGAPLALLPLYAAYTLWTLGTAALLVLACRRIGLPWAACGLLLLSPGLLVNVLFGQNGALTAALLLAGLHFSAAAPARAGASFGLLTFKPQMGLLVPVALVAAGRWRTILWSAVFGVAFALATTALFGLDAWRGFLDVTAPLMRSILEAPYGQGYHANSITIFALLRALGLDLASAYAGQGAVSLVALAATVWLWRLKRVDEPLRLAAMGPLVLLVTPYSFTYDMVLTSVSVLILFVRRGYRFGPVLAAVWLWPPFNHLWNEERLPVVAPLLLIALAVICLRELSASLGPAPAAPARTA